MAASTVTTCNSSPLPTTPLLSRSSNTSTVDPATARPLITCWVVAVRPSVASAPVSDEICSPVGAAKIKSKDTETGLVHPDSLPAAST